MKKRGSLYRLIIVLCGIALISIVTGCQLQATGQAAGRGNEMCEGELCKFATKGDIERLDERIDSLENNLEVVVSCSEDNSVASKDIVFHSEEGDQLLAHIESKECSGSNSNACKEGVGCCEIAVTQYCKGDTLMIEQENTCEENSASVSEVSCSDYSYYWQTGEGGYCNPETSKCETKCNVGDTIYSCLAGEWKQYICLGDESGSGWESTGVEKETCPAGASCYDTIWGAGSCA